ncbi:unnamed protein product [Taenia asiatica]|uniref:NR LBD domain-containing protein n=1 Tax=Taenia asiatica TaxID=60517 RepID=A0A0R3VY51_TAEAS|nr:unnamed protein product [Taenia asiatica]
MESDYGNSNKDSSSPIFKVEISESSLEWQGHSEKSPPPITVQGVSSMRTYSSCFCAWLREVNALRREVTRAFLLGPFLMLHNLMMVPADLGLLPSLVRPDPSEVETAITVVQRQVFRRIQLPLDKLLHVQKVTKASFSEISMSLLSGALRAYQQVGMLAQNSAFIHSLYFIMISIPTSHAAGSSQLDGTQNTSPFPPSVEDGTEPFYVFLNDVSCIDLTNRRIVLCGHV